MKKVLFVLLAMGLLAAVPSQSEALVTENWLIDIARITTPQPQGLYDRGTIYDYNAGVWVPVNNGSAQNMTDGVWDDDGDGVEDAWGIFRVASIINTTTSATVFDGATASDQIVGMFYGFDDVFLELQGNGTTTVYGIDGRMELWRNSNDFAASVALGSGGRAGDTFSGITDGTLLLEADGHARTIQFGALAGEQYTFASLFNFNEPYGGSGDFYLDVDPTSTGLWTELLNSDGFLPSTQNPADVFINFSSQGLDAPDDWTVFGNGQGNAKAVVPEPTSMILMGIGLAGAALRRKKMG